MQGYRTRLGEKFSEGARLMWLKLAEKKWNVEDLARECGWARGVGYRYLWGDRRPEFAQGKTIERVLGIHPDLFHAAPKRRFNPAAARAAA